MFINLRMKCCFIKWFKYDTLQSLTHLHSQHTMGQANSVLTSSFTLCYKERWMFVTLGKPLRQTSYQNMGVSGKILG